MICLVLGAASRVPPLFLALFLSITLSSSPFLNEHTHTQVIAVRWEEIPWESLAFPTTSWALWHHRLRAEEAAAQTSFGESTAPGGRRGGEPGVNSVELEGSVLAERVGGGAGGRSRGGGSGGAGLGLGSGLGLVSHGAVFSTPSSNSSVFWSPNKGLHLKDGWNVSTDS